MKKSALYFTKPYRSEIVEEKLAGPGRDRVIVQTILSAISPGTEMLIYRGQAPDDLAMDDSIAALSGPLTFPLKYGYCAVGRVVEVGKDVERDWLNKLVFAFNPHETFFAASPDDLLPVPDDIELQEAVFLPNVETAVNFVMDGHPLVGERIVVFGQGIVGLLTTALLTGIPLARVVTVDLYPLRRETSLALGAQASLDPGSADFFADLQHQLDSGGAFPGVDLAYEISGAPHALDQAIRVTGFGGRIVIGSWYGRKPIELSLGGRFHRARICLISSQVSTLNPGLTGRWDKRRRIQVAWEAIRRIHPARFITQRIPFEQAATAYELLDRRPEEAIQVVLTYGSGL